MSSFPDFSFKGNISLFQAVGLAVVGYERKREGEREKKRGGPLVFSLARPLFFARPQLPRAWNRLIFSLNEKSGKLDTGEVGHKQIIR